MVVGSAVRTVRWVGSAVRTGNPGGLDPCNPTAIIRYTGSKPMTEGAASAPPDRRELQQEFEDRGDRVMRGRIVAVGLALGLLSAAIYAQVRDQTPPATAGAYRVTRWPEHTGPDESYAKEVEEHLNKMAADAWRFHSVLVGQSVKMMVFERSGGR